MDKKVPKVDFNHTCLAVITLGCALKKDKSYYLKVFSKCVNTLKNVIRHINNDLSYSCSSDESDEKELSGYCFLRKQFGKCIFWESLFKNVFNLKEYF